jgi:hypothetical protein
MPSSPTNRRAGTELHRLRGFGFKRLLVIGRREDIAAGHYHSRIAPKMLSEGLPSASIPSFSDAKLADAMAVNNRHQIAPHLGIRPRYRE